MSAARHLTNTQLRDLADELRTERARLERSIATRTGAEDSPVATGNGLWAAKQTAGGLAVALETRMLDRHEMIDSALGRLEDGTYGVCMSCRGPISYGRLLVMPEATYCVSCGAGV
jgi:RNA polymerase-binding transcription factor DksA